MAEHLMEQPFLGPLEEALKTLIVVTTERTEPGAA
jgi:hypothetical protein